MFKIIYPCGSEFTDKGVFLPKKRIEPTGRRGGKGGTGRSETKAKTVAWQVEQNMVVHISQLKANQDPNRKKTEQNPKIRHVVPKILSKRVLRTKTASCTAKKLKPSNAKKSETLCTLSLDPSRVPRVVAASSLDLSNCSPTARPNLCAARAPPSNDFHPSWRARPHDNLQWVDLRAKNIHGNVFVRFSSKSVPDINASKTWLKLQKYLESWHVH